MQEWIENLKNSVEEFFTSTVNPAFEEIKKYLEGKGKKVIIKSEFANSLKITVFENDDEEFSYAIGGISYAEPDKNFPKGRAIPHATKWIRHKELSRRDKTRIYFIKKEPCNIEDISQKDIINHFNNEFMFQLKDFIL